MPYCRVGIELCSVEVRFEDLDIETSVFVGSRALPSVTNRFLDYAQARSAPAFAPLLFAALDWPQNLQG